MVEISIRRHQCQIKRRSGGGDPEVIFAHLYRREIGNQRPMTPPTKSVNFFVAIKHILVVNIQRPDFSQARSHLNASAVTHFIPVKQRLYLGKRDHRNEAFFFFRELMIRRAIKRFRL